MLFHTVLVSAILPPRRQWCHVDVSRGVVRGQNLHSTPKWRPEGDVMCTVTVHESTVWGKQLDHRAAASTVRAEKRGKSPAKPRKKTEARRSVGCGPFEFSVKLGPALTTGWGQRKNAAANQCSPELGSAVSGVVENLSRKIHKQTTKSYAYGVENVYLLWWVC
jgi:hypothetical protein